MHNQSYSLDWNLALSAFFGSKCLYDVLIWNLWSHLMISTNDAKVCQPLLGHPVSKININKILRLILISLQDQY